MLKICNFALLFQIQNDRLEFIADVRCAWVAYVNAVIFCAYVYSGHVLKYLKHC